MLHLNALEIGLSHERQRLAAATSAGERELHAVWVRQYEKEIVAERQFLGLPDHESTFAMTDDELLAELSK